MAMTLRLVVGGLPRGTPIQDVQMLLAPCETTDLHLVDLPGDDDQAMAIVRLPGDARQADRLRARLNQRRIQGHALWTWVTVLPWS